MQIKEIEHCIRKILEILAQKEVISVEELIDLSGCNNYYILIALGWLSRENVISFSDNNGNLEIRLNNPFQETYY